MWIRIFNAKYSSFATSTSVESTVLGADINTACTFELQMGMKKGFPPYSSSLTLLLGRASPPTSEVVDIDIEKSTSVNPE